MYGSGNESAGESAVAQLPPQRAHDVVDVLCDAFYHYPVTRFVLGDEGDYDARIRVLIGYFVANDVIAASLGCALFLFVIAYGISATRRITFDV